MVKVFSVVFFGIISFTVFSLRCIYFTFFVFINLRLLKGFYYGLSCDFLEMGFGVLSGTLVWF